MSGIFKYNTLREILLGTQGITLRWPFKNEILVCLLQHVMGLLKYLLGLQQHDKGHTLDNLVLCLGNHPAVGMVR